MDEGPLLIVEEGSSGHLLVYVRMLTEYALANGIRVVIALPPHVQQSPEYEKHLAGLEKAVSVVDAPDRLTARNLCSLASSTSARLVVVPNADGIASRYALSTVKFRSANLALLVMRDPAWEYPSSVFRRGKNLLKRSLLAITAARRNVHLVWLREPTYAGSTRQLYAVDPFIGDGSEHVINAGAEQIRSELGMDNGTFWFGVTGAISARKNVPLVAEALGRVKATNPGLSVGLAIFGPISESAGFTKGQMRDRCEALGVGVIVCDRLISNLEMNSFVKAVDAVVMAYSTHSPNSTLGKAYVIGTRLVAAGPPSVRRFVVELGMGPAAPLEVEALARLMSRAVSTPVPVSHYGSLTQDQFASALIREEWF